MIIDRLKSLAVFAEIVRQGSLRGAAKKLNFTPSAVSYHLKILEDEAGQPLLYRSTRSFSMTTAGEILFTSAQDMINAAEAGFYEISNEEQKLKGHFRIALTSALSHSFISTKLSEFLKTHSQLDVSLHYDNQQSDLISDRFDMALRTGTLNDSSLKCRLIWSMPRTLVASPKYFDSKKIPEHPNEIDELDWIKFENLSYLRTLHDRNNHTVQVKQKGNLTVNSIEAMVDMTMCGNGISPPPTHFVSHLIKQGHLVEVLPNWSVSDIPVHAVWPNSKARNPATRSFLKLLTTSETFPTHTCR